MNSDVLQLITSMLVPGIMIIASAILMLFTDNKYSLIVNRIRLLKEERAKLFQKEQPEKIPMKKLDKIELQLSHLIHRISMVRVMFVSFSSAILFFTVSCVLLSVRNNTEINGYFWVSIGFIFGGLLALINGVVFSVIEMFKGYRIVHIEISEISNDLSG